MRPKQTDCQIEPSFPDHATVLFSIRFPDLVGHLPTLRCSIQEPHHIDDCQEFDRLAPTLPVSASRVDREQIARKLAGYDDATWFKLREDRKRTYRRAADSLITLWPEFVALLEVKS